MRLRPLIEFLQPQQTTCLRCGDAYFDALECGLCPSCALHATRILPDDLRPGLLHGREQLDWAGAAYAYTEGVRQRVYALKYGGARRLGEAMGRDMAANARALNLTPVVVPVPLHWTRRLRRGYNQAEALARGLAAETGWQLDARVLRRNRRTRSNARLAHERRAANVANAFAATRAVPGGRFLLIDDVLTTGSTAGQCARALRQAGAEWVGIMTYARAGSASRGIGAARRDCSAARQGGDAEARMPEYVGGVGEI